MRRTQLSISDEALRACYEAGESTLKLEASLGVCKNTVRNRLKRLGVAMRTRGRSVVGEVGKPYAGACLRCATVYVGFDGCPLCGEPMPRTHHLRVRAKALAIVGRGVVACVVCGCDYPPILEINHINGGGSREARELGSKMEDRILSGKRPIDDLDLRCKPCNALHCLEMRHGELPYEIRWKGNPFAFEEAA